MGQSASDAGGIPIYSDESNEDGSRTGRRAHGAKAVGLPATTHASGRCSHPVPILFPSCSQNSDSCRIDWEI